METNTQSEKPLGLQGAFFWLSLTSFFGAFNDNVFRWLIIGYLIVNQPDVPTSTTMALGGAVFVIPFLIFSALAGTWADRHSKRNIIVAVKCFEILVMLLGVGAFLLDNPTAVYGILFLMAMQSAFFGPAKYGIVPELVGKKNISRANGLLEMATWTAIILGMTSGLYLSRLANEFNGHYEWAALVCILVSLLGIATCLPIRRTEPAGGTRQASWLFFRDIWQTFYHIRRKKKILIATLASACFMFLGAFIQFNTVPYGMTTFNLVYEQSGLLFLVAALGIGVGSITAGKISGKGVEVGLVPLGALGMTICMVFLGLVPESKAAVSIALFALGFSGGLFIVPIHAFIQYHSPKEQLGEILAASGFLGWVGVMLASGMIYLLNDLFKFTAAQSFIIFGLFTLGLTFILLKILPDFFARIIFLLITRICYRVKMHGLENVPKEGPALIISNHVSWVDGVLLMATQNRTIRFLIGRDIYHLWWLKPLCRLGEFIPISDQDPPKKIIVAFRQARQALEKGDLVAIFAEGAITRTGLMRSFKPGFERIVKGLNVPIIPTYIGGAWGSVFSHARGKLLSGLPKSFSYPISIHFGQPLTGDFSAFEIRRKVSELSCDYFDQKKNKKRSLAYQYIKTARRNWFKPALADSTTRTFTHGRSLIAALTLGSILKPKVGSDKMVGILLPACVPGALVNIALTCLEKVPVNLNFTVGPESLQSAIDQCQIRCVLTSKKFIQKIKCNLDQSQMVFVEDLMGQITLSHKITSVLKAIFAPLFLYAHPRSGSPDDLATIIFSSGSTGKPKGVMLSHHNIISNIEAARDVFRFTPKENICGVLPFFHSFGFTATIWLPLLSGISAVYIANPMETAAIARSVKKHRSTMLLSTPTFLGSYTRRIDREDFSSLRMVVTGAEKLKSRTAEAFEKAFGLRPMEGYGTTELSPIVSLNLLDVELSGHTQRGNKEGTVGHPLPGVTAKVVDLDTNQPLAENLSGLLLIKGPNVMQGYLNNEVKTRKVMRDGWYVTGDMAQIDEDGFITITDRLARFSKIGGEMVAHVAIEEIYLQALDTAEQLVAVTSIPDEKKGEQLAVLYLEQAGDPKTLHNFIEQSNLANISKPRLDNYYKIDAIPILGTGKLDILGLRQLALAANEK
jgi:acyl-[acyl-carrier-protein]-phospholipid O-acyltransferase/long-chain-fatty-acid--[acyl-carrier-protein] ligase